MTERSERVAALDKERSSASASTDPSSVPTHKVKEAVYCRARDALAKQRERCAKSLANFLQRGGWGADGKRLVLEALFACSVRPIHGKTREQATIGNLPESELEHTTNSLSPSLPLSLSH